MSFPQSAADYDAFVAQVAAAGPFSYIPVPPSNTFENYDNNNNNNNNDDDGITTNDSPREFGTMQDVDPTLVRLEQFFPPDSEALQDAVVTDEFLRTSEGNLTDAIGDCSDRTTPPTTPDCFQHDDLSEDTASVEEDEKPKTNKNKKKKKTVAQSARPAKRREALTKIAEKSQSQPQAKATKGKKTAKKQAQRKFIAPAPVPLNLQAAIDETLHRAAQCNPGTTRQIGHAMTPLVRYLIEQVRAGNMTQDEARALLIHIMPQWEAKFYPDFMTKVCRGSHMRCHLGDFKPFEARARASAPRGNWNHVVPGDALWYTIFNFWLKNRSMPVSEMADCFGMARATMDALIKKQFLNFV